MLAARPHRHGCRTVDDRDVNRADDRDDDRDDDRGAAGVADAAWVSTGGIALPLPDSAAVALAANRG